MQIGGHFNSHMQVMLFANCICFIGVTLEIRKSGKADMCLHHIYVSLKDDPCAPKLNVNYR
jgi:hypothetical protein